MEASAIDSLISELLRHVEEATALIEELGSCSPTALRSCSSAQGEPAH